MATQLKSGTMLRYKKRIFGKDWREEYVMLFNDSTLLWYKDKGRSEPDGGIIIKDSPELIAYGQFTARVPGRPELPTGYKISQLLAFGTRGSNMVQWFLGKNEDDVMEWMTAISNTLPPPPQPPQNTDQAPPVANSQYADNPPPYQYPGQQQGPPPQQAFHPNTAPAYNGYFGGPPMMAPPQQVPQNTTVVVQQQDRHTDGNFAMGLMLGGALGWGMGHGWGYGGWGYGGGYGGGWGGGYYGNDVFIDNHYDVNNTIVNNDFQQDVQNDYDTSAFDGADFDCGGDFGF